MQWRRGRRPGRRTECDRSERSAVARSATNPTWSSVSVSATRTWSTPRGAVEVAGGNDETGRGEILGDGPTVAGAIDVTQPQVERRRPAVVHQAARLERGQRDRPARRVAQLLLADVLVVAERGAAAAWTGAGVMSPPCLRISPR